MRPKKRTTKRVGSKKGGLGALEKKLWKVTREVVFLLYGTDCYTCTQVKLHGVNLQCGHGFPKGALGASMKYDVRILRPQCFRCNINHGGMGAVFWKRLEDEMGKRAADKLYLECQSSKGKPIVAYPHYERLLAEYGDIIERNAAK